ncbi:bifunctional hydroxymethylpyrimidine kinase/phosphomethylpyrimidine kinase [Marinospirillum alkaliphilum]|uniref:hydroxymethylpyrimidine kinase n=1 Tax=Marinospirillum alkaliphilum DSM 21637 TaxID=1122209 RepID=A0A1K1WHV6_9GAMM|nr:hydroxymethylpyrimidine/phosphomethylpyrimidine kinase [Marinospirillum alkaliphilum]SFX36831.1 hydroxymethylpyrimidine/phosphomethylpyrimidine kinase [Marinospirillum alkaliphilum DSM 21637]
MIKPGVHPQFQKNYPAVLAIGGHDPSGGAGILADAQALLALKAWPLTLITCLTAQNTHQVNSVKAQDPADFHLQLETLLQDFRPAAIKIGVTGSLDIQQSIAELLLRYPDIPVVLDPVISSTSGTGFMNEQQLTHLKEHLLPRSSVITPNLPELEQLVPGKKNPEDKARELLRQGCKAVLLTGAHAQSRGIKNQLFTHPSIPPLISRWKRLPYEYHGSGCTLAAALAGLLARGESLEKASTQAQDFTWQSLEKALKLTEGQHLPLRLREPAHG